jgi:hypothetical protein
LAGSGKKTRLLKFRATINGNIVCLTKETG